MSEKKVMKSNNKEKVNKKVDRVAIKEALLDLTEGFLSSVTDVILMELFFGLNLLVAGSYSGSVYRASRAAEEMFESVKIGTVKTTCHQLKNKGYITYVRGKNAAANAKLTKAGLERIKNILPQYKKDRPWDGRLYLITYDVPENRNRDRDTLRQLLRKLGCGLLQQSVWVTPHNPKGILEKAIKEYGIFGDIIVSDTGREGNIGKTNFKELMERVYNLHMVNDRYAEFIKKYKSRGRGSKEYLMFKFLSIVEDDPQLPYELLPDNWLGDRAYASFKKLKDSG